MFKVPYPVKTKEILFLFATSITSLSFFEPPGWIMPLILFLEHNLTISEKGKNRLMQELDYIFIRFHLFYSLFCSFKTIHLPYQYQQLPDFELKQ